ncbi:MAG: DUF3299 domain-containing protein [Planctomycetota bacterium]|nr:DUF3299 domain-containing protein [Planctomycetota bacterium]
MVGTVWLNSIMPGEQSRPRPAVLKGEPINAKRSAWSQGALTNRDLEALTQADGSGFVNITFDVLGSFNYELPMADGIGRMPLPIVSTGPKLDISKPADQIPKPIRELNGKKVAVQGFMVPFRMQRGALKSFQLVKDRSLCCFGRDPRINDVVHVTMAGGRSTAWVNDQAITVFGIIEVGELVENGVLQSIYRLRAEEVVGGLDY